MLDGCGVHWHLDAEGTNRRYCTSACLRKAQNAAKKERYRDRKDHPKFSHCLVCDARWAYGQL